MNEYAALIDTYNLKINALLITQQSRGAMHKKLVHR